MAIREMPASSWGVRTGFVIMLSVLIGCEGQDPAFKEIATQNGEVFGSDQSFENQSMNAEAAGSGNAAEELSASAKNPDSENSQGSSTGDDGSEDGSLIDGEEPPLDFEFVSMQYTQETESKVDILWVIDSSGSMAEEQSYLGSKFSSFISALSSAGTDFQTAITSTDVCQDPRPTDPTQIACPVDYGGGDQHLRGSFVGDEGRRVLTSNDGDLVEKFVAYTNVGTEGSGFEHGLKGAQLAISKVLSGDNEALLRENSFLSVIVVSDEEDDGIGLGMEDLYNHNNFVEMGLTEFRYTHNDLKDYLTSVVGAGKFAISTITGTKDDDGNMCESPHSSPREEGSQYIAAANATGGIVQSICDTDWDNSLYNIGMDISAQITQISLAQTAFVPSIRVYVDGEMTTSWTFIAGTNVVKFNTDSIPEDGSVIKVEYYGAP